MKWNDTYYIYELPMRKIGCTNNLHQRCTVEQGFKPGEYNILAKINNIFLASYKELELQEQHGYRIDNKPYYTLFNRDNKLMRKTHSTKLTTGFKINDPSELKALVGSSITLNTPFEGDLVFDTPEKIQWLEDNLIESHSGEDWHLPYYVKNKLAYEYLQSLSSVEVVAEYKVPNMLPSIDELTMKIKQWHKDAGILDQSTQMHQAFKIAEEYGELAKAIIKDEGLDKIEDALGDMFVVMISVAELSGTSINKCIDDAYNEIKDRLKDGGMVGSDFRKNLKEGKAKKNEIFG